MAQLDSKLDQKVPSLDSKLDVILKSLFGIKQVDPSEAERADQLYQLISLRFKHTLEEVDQKYNDNLDHHISTTTTMLKIHDDMISATNELIKQTHVRQEKQIQRLEKEIKGRTQLDYATGYDQTVLSLLEHRRRSDQQVR